MAQNNRLLKATEVDMDDELIFVSIAAYRDPQLGPTIEDCLRKAAHPERLRFGICWQKDEQEPALPCEGDDRFRVLAVDWQQSRGACWARAEIMKLWSGEPWFLQVDSHCRFAAGWDKTLPLLMRETGARRPLLSTYASPFTPGEHEVLIPGPMQIGFQAFTPEGIPQLQPLNLLRRSMTERVGAARFLAAGFLFASGSFVEDVPYDPELYFMGEEIAMTVRAFTHGYDLFHPTETVIWHDYLRTGSRKHWGDHTAENKVARSWGELDTQSKQKVQRLLRGEMFTPFGLGTERTIADYEAYAGLSFRLRKAQLNTVRAGALPNPAVAENWAEAIQPWIARVKLKRSQLPQGALDDPAIWALSIEDDAGYAICRVDLTRADLAPLYGDQEELELICEFPSETLPASWVLKVQSHSKGWLRNCQGRLNDGDFAVLEDED